MVPEEEKTGQGGSQGEAWPDGIDLARPVILQRVQGLRSTRSGGFENTVYTRMGIQWQPLSGMGEA